MYIHFVQFFTNFCSYQLGSSTKDLGLCEKLFTCDQSPMEIIELMQNEPTAENIEKEEFQLQSRSNCIAANKLCPGISAGCGLCGLFSPATCGDQCIVAGIYCGVSAFACKAEQKVKNKKKRPYGGRAQRLSSKYLQNFYA